MYLQLLPTALPDLFRFPRFLPIVPSCVLVLSLCSDLFRFLRFVPICFPNKSEHISISNMTGWPGYRTMEMNGGSSASYLARGIPNIPSDTKLLLTKNDSERAYFRSYVFPWKGPSFPEILRVRMTPERRIILTDYNCGNDFVSGGTCLLKPKIAPWRGFQRFIKLT